MRLLLSMTIALFVAAAPAAAEVRTLAEVHTPDRGGRTTFPVVDAYGGRVVWSDYDAAIGAWRLMEHARGVTRAVPVAPRATPFDVDLGPDGRGGTTAVYSRCARRIPLDRPTPQLQRARRYGCDLYAFSFTTGRETKRLSSRADEYWPSVWGGRIAFVRGYTARRDPDRTSTPYLYMRHGDRRSRRLRRPPSFITVRMSGPEGRRTERVRLSTMIEDLDLRRRTVAYAWKRIDDFDTASFIYTATAGGALRPAARGATSGGGAATSIRSVGAPSLSAGRIDWLFTNRGEPEYFGAFVRRPAQASPRTKAVAFAHAGGVAYFVDGGPGAEFEPAAQPGGTFALKADDAVAYSRMPRGWLPIRPPR
jgi:hypothetical protein